MEVSLFQISLDTLQEYKSNPHVQSNCHNHNAEQKNEVEGASDLAYIDQSQLHTCHFQQSV